MFKGVPSYYATGTEIFVKKNQSNLNKTKQNKSRTGSPDTFEVKLFESSARVEIHIQSATTDGQTLSVGMENAAGTDGCVPKKKRVFFFVNLKWI